MIGSGNAIGNTSNLHVVDFWKYFLPQPQEKIVGSPIRQLIPGGSGPLSHFFTNEDKGHQLRC